LQIQTKAAPQPSFTPVQTGLLQRKRACGQHTIAGGECEECSKKHEGTIQRAAVSAAPTNSVPPIVHDVLSSSGHPLDARTRAFMEPRFGHDFSGVRVHTDARATESARAVNALAYTVGRDVVFGQGEYKPGTSEGRRLLAHELTHVVQQQRATQPLHGVRVAADRDSVFEREANNTAKEMPAIRHSVPSTLEMLSLQKADTVPAPRSPRPEHEVIAIQIDHREAGGLGRFDALLYRDCSMKVQLRMNFTFRGPWPKESDKKDWQNNFIATVKTAWSRKFMLVPTGECKHACPRVTSYVEIYAPHTLPHVNITVTYTKTFIQSRAGFGGADLDTLDLTPTQKPGSVEKQVPAFHEFGHLLGRPDTYMTDAAGNPICTPGYPLAGVMCRGNTVTDQDYVPFANVLNKMTGCTYKVVLIGDFPIPSRQPSEAVV